MCEQRKHGSVGAGAGNRPGYPTEHFHLTDDGPVDLVKIAAAAAKTVGGDDGTPVAVVEDGADGKPIVAAVNGGLDIVQVRPERQAEPE